jgi:hypothetical protein
MEIDYRALLTKYIAMETEVLEGFVTRIELQSLDRNGRSCEVCDGHMWEHDWVFMDVHGFVIRCSIREEVNVR